ncbi:MAG: translation initiation factor IF-2 [Actinobacteria bacterium]|nr:translation initiation factor IF-2 [Actinomycetota bacterium]
MTGGTGRSNHRVRVHELARELGVSSKEILEALEEMGLGGRTASSSVPEEAVPRLRASGGKPIPGAKPRTAREEPLPRRRPEKAARPVEETPPAADATGDGDGRVPTAEKVPPEAAEVAPAGAAARGDGDGAAQALAPSGPPVLKIPRGATPQDIAERTERTAAEVVKVLFGMGQMVSASQSLPDETIELLAGELGYEAEITGIEEAEEPAEEEVDESRLRPRGPVVTVMGHVDHGKTLLLDAIRKTDVVSGEFGGITQHIGAYQVHDREGREIAFIDTPGHEAFTAMRARGAQITDIAVLVVAADDGVMPQTTEALNHARAAGVPIVVAVNKVDKPEADPQRVRQQLVDQGVVPSEWGGTHEFVDVSAKHAQNLDQLLETILLVAELEELRADPEAPPRGVVIEAHLDRGRGPVATVLVQRGTLRVGDAVVSGTVHGKVRAMLDEHGANLKEAGPSKPAQVLGWTAVPEAGDDFRVVEDDREARHLAQEREARARQADLVASRPPGLQELIALTRESGMAELNLVVKADVQGSLEALIEALDKLPQDEVRLRVIHRAVGAINEGDVSLALASRAVVVGFNVRPDAGATALADREGVDVRLYRVIYEAIDDIRQALSGLLSPEERVVELGQAEVRAVFSVPRGRIAGCYVTRGMIHRNDQARLVRDGVVVYEGRIGSLRRFKEDVREVNEGFECGIGLENFNDVKEGDLIETFEVREIARSL